MTTAPTLPADAPSTLLAARLRARRSALSDALSAHLHADGQRDENVDRCFLPRLHVPLHLY